MPQCCGTRGKIGPWTSTGWLQVPVVAPSSDVFVLRDVLHLPTASAQQVPSPPTAAGLRLQLLADPSAPDRLYAVHARGGSNTVNASSDSVAPVALESSFICVLIWLRCQYFTIRRHIGGMLCLGEHQLLTPWFALVNRSTVYIIKFLCNRIIASWHGVLAMLGGFVTGCCHDP